MKCSFRGRYETEGITISNNEYGSVNKTIEILSDNDLMAQIKRASKRT